jgi:L-gulono-1,4-lactone dehydrogenase
MPVWRNHTGNQSSKIVEERAPKTLDELVALVRDAERRGLTVRAVGAGHAWSDVALTTGIVVDPVHLSGLLELDVGPLPPGSPPLVRVLGGTPIQRLNELLRERGLALRNMGGYDAQTIAGVVATSTHGSGLAWGPFPDLVRSLDLVIAGGEVVRVEPADGITDPARFGGTLLQDDDTFFAAVCGMGSTGLVHSLVIEVRERFWLNEVRTVSTWEEVRDSLTPAGVLGQGDHYELFLNPYAGDDGRHRVLVTRRGDCPAPVGLPKDKLERHPLTELEASSPITWFLLRVAARFLPGLVAKRFDGVLDGMRDDGYANISYKVFNIGEANHLPAYSMELGVSLDANRHVECIDRLLEIAAERRKRERLVHTSPIALRFVRPSRAFASMMYERPTMMIELIMVVGTRGGERLLAGYEERLADLDVRPHWGQLNSLTPERIAQLYPRWPDWLAVERRFNASGAFNSPFTARVGISSATPEPPAPATPAAA